MVMSFRYWFSARLLDLVRLIHPPAKDGHAKGRVWQIIEVPRRISKHEAEELASQVKDY